MLLLAACACVSTCMEAAAVPAAPPVPAAAFDLPFSRPWHYGVPHRQSVGRSWSVVLTFFLGVWRSCRPSLAHPTELHTYGTREQALLATAPVSTRAESLHAHTRLGSQLLSLTAVVAPLRGPCRRRPLGQCRCGACDGVCGPSSGCPCDACVELSGLRVVNGRASR